MLHSHTVRGTLFHGLQFKPLFVFSIVFPPRSTNRTGCMFLVPVL